MATVTPRDRDAPPHRKPPEIGSPEGRIVAGGGWDRRVVVRGQRRALVARALLLAWSGLAVPSSAATWWIHGASLGLAAATVAVAGVVGLAYRFARLRASEPASEWVDAVNEGGAPSRKDTRPGAFY